MRASTIRPAAAALSLVLVAALAACAPSGAQQETAARPAAEPATVVAPAAAASEDAAPEEAPTASADASAATASPEPADPIEPAEPLVLDATFEARDGAITLRYPSSWEVQDASRLCADPSCATDWQNLTYITAPDGTSVSYAEFLYPAAGYQEFEGEWGFVERTPVDDRFEAVSWWSTYDGEHFSSTVTLVERGRDDRLPNPYFPGEPGARQLHALLPGHASSADGAAAMLLAETGRTAAAVIASAVLVDLPAQSFPPDMVVTVGGERMVRYTTRNGSASFPVPLDWRIDDTSFRAPIEGEPWLNQVIFTDETGMVYHGIYEERARTPWESTVRDGVVQGNARPTVDGYAAMSFAEIYDSGLAMSRWVALVDPERPRTSICFGDFCRSMSVSYDYVLPTYVDVDPDSFFGSPLEERALAIVAALDVHHSDVTRQP